MCKDTKDILELSSLISAHLAGFDFGKARHVLWSECAKLVESGHINTMSPYYLMGVAYRVCDGRVDKDTEVTMSLGDRCGTVSIKRPSGVTSSVFAVMDGDNMSLMITISDSAGRNRYYTSSSEAVAGFLTAEGTTDAT